MERETEREPDRKTERGGEREHAREIERERDGETDGETDLSVLRRVSFLHCIASLSDVISFYVEERRNGEEKMWQKGDKKEKQ